jgi:Domain of unknown function (DUF4158)
MFSRQQLKHAATLTEEDLKQISKCRRPYNRLGFAYQVAFVRLFNRFPRQQPFEIVEELANLSAAQLGFDVGLLEFYRKRQPTISEHQETITRYLPTPAFWARPDRAIGEIRIRGVLAPRRNRCAQGSGGGIS